MGNKTKYHYDNRVGKKKRRGFCGTAKQDIRQPVNNVNTPPPVNTPVNNDNVNNETVNTPFDERTNDATVIPAPLPTAAPVPDVSVQSAPPVPVVSGRPVPILEPSTSSAPETPSKSNVTHPTQNASPLKKSIAAKIAMRKFRKLTNKSADKIKRNSTLSRRLPMKSRRTVISKRCSVKSKTLYQKMQGYKLIDSSILNDVLSSNVSCLKCRAKGMQLQEFCGNKKGLSEFLRLTCMNCGFSKNFQTSKRQNRFYEVNIRSVLAAQPVGRAGLETFCGIINLPKPVGKNSYNRIQDKIADIANELSDEVLDKSAKTLFDITSEKNPENIIEHDNINYAKVGVSVDGTWMKRGHQSKLGVVFVQSIETGEVLDFEVKSLFCHVCAKYKKRLSSKKFDEWYKGHESKCKINHKGSSDKMECEGAIQIFLRSMERRLIYHLYVGDGDSSSFGKVKEACYEKYGEKYIVTKEECSGHVQKRMGTRLRELKKKWKGVKLDDGKGIGGSKTRLTDKWIDDFQKFYGQAIRSNSGNKKEMGNAIWAIFYHCIKGNDDETLEKQHAYCPRDGWCKYWADRDNYNQHKCLDPVFRKLLKPTFESLSDDSLLSRCLLGVTQNQNEAINGILWRYCNKNSFNGLKKLKLAASLTVGRFNSGEGFISDIIEKLGFQPGDNTINAQTRKDKARITAAEKKISGESRLRRQDIRTHKKKKSEKESQSVTYFPGAFGLSATPDIDLGGEAKSKPKRKSSNPAKPSLPKKKKPDALPQVPIQPPTQPEDLEVKICFVSDESVLLIKSKMAKNRRR